ncbi:MAG TPA: NAD-dependent succinate-semialdehyde dehydrogenase [Clostridia bacterium]|nr:NAD-dependent succinate-semialdehyde dehydrogenase [Clostridia bacterium]
MPIRTQNPATGEVLRSFDSLSDSDIDKKLQLASETFRAWRKTPFTTRGKMMREAAKVLEQNKREYARLMTMEMGKPIGAAVQEVEKCARGCDFYAENAERLLADDQEGSEPTRSFVTYQPLGAVLAIMPWNFPMWQVFRFAAPGLMAGNVGLLKHASNVPQCALAIEDVFKQAGFPEGTFQTLLIGSDKVNRIIEDERIAAVTLTGSVDAGRSVAATAGKVIKKSVLELGGSDPFIVMPSANLDRTVNTAVQARTINNGQSCIAAKRFIVHEKIAQEFEQKFAERMKELQVGDPMDEKTDVGPLATEDVLGDLERQVQETVKAGARVLCGGKRLDGPGFFYAPTALADIPKGTPAHDDELFGPVASLFRARDMANAIEIANDTKFGLGSSLWSNDEHERSIFIERIEAGMAFINGMVASDPRIPFGGVKQSGYGRELSVNGIREFVNVKTVCIYELESASGSSTE